ncbi:MAG: hypothetical protein NT040_02020 [Bacteroidetes bacterium]|nr:hypothetical protein [Bacteroidota bacterium]
MNRIPPISLFWLVLLLTFPCLAQKTARKQPACLLDPAKAVRIDQVISEHGTKLAGPWIVYANRGADFGEKFYVVDEDLTKFLVYSGTGVNGLTIQNAHEVGWKPKQNYLFRFSADFTRDALIHRKCVVLNSSDLVDSICSGLIDESRIPVYQSPTDLEPITLLPLYSIYFIYQSEKNRYLLGKDYSFNPSAPFSSQIIGWVDAKRVFNYDNRLCFEPNFQSGSVQKRRCDTLFGNAKVFSTSSELGVFLANRNVSIEPLWEEPDYFYLAPSIEKDLKSGRATPGWLRNAIGKDKCWQSSDCFRTSFTNERRSSEFFRFPFLAIDRSDRKIFMVAAAGKYLRSSKSICDSLHKNKKRLKVFFILPDSLPNTYAVFFLNQLHSKYTAFTKRYNASYFPGPPGRLSLADRAAGPAETYNMLLDSLIGHKPGSLLPGNQNCFARLNQVLDKEPFNPQETNLIVVINTNKTPFIQNEMNAHISAKLSEKNCYLLAFDLSDNPSFISTVDEIIRNAIGAFNKTHGLGPVPIRWEQSGKCSVMTNYLLAATMSIDTAGLKGPQILDYIQDSYDPVISTISRVISAECNSRTDTAGLTPNETAFRLGLEKILPDCRRNISSVRILQKGYTRMQYQNSTNSRDNIWQAEVLMTEGELVDMTSTIDGLTIDLSSTNVCNGICDLWQTLIKRFIGENMILDNSFLDYTIPQLLDRIIGASFGYSSSDRIKNFNIRQICECQDEVNGPAVEYKNMLHEKNQTLKAILHQKAFVIEREAGASSDVKYFWVPVSSLP